MRKCDCMTELSLNLLHATTHWCEITGPYRRPMLAMYCSTVTRMTSLNLLFIIRPIRQHINIKTQKKIKHTLKNL